MDACDGLCDTDQTYADELMACPSFHSLINIAFLPSDERVLQFSPLIRHKTVKGFESLVINYYNINGWALGVGSAHPNHTFSVCLCVRESSPKNICKKAINPKSERLVIYRYFSIFGFSLLSENFFPDHCYQTFFYIFSFSRSLFAWALRFPRESSKFSLRVL